ncbi:4-hydroxy-tetrahydrodipicolinate synthase [Bosea sp. F3-2]|uniref:dihydrodipicolinate synthase family protein n=1 Tax=Bosea sp. F3-2 TaxID=2599640 RepID=UPI0011EE0A32|nr:dihydrodipicolinate synthase family protein [Bosea sp. F3-2]QEL25679.1 4-hydroxy-tetrahydrodipicolinate synthase [Bosea sp. F3-2]
MNHWLHGMFTALVTPFDEDAIDYGALERLIHWQIAQGADGIVVGTAAGESPTLSEAEHQQLCAAARRIAGRHFPVIAAVGSYATAETIAEIAAAEKAGASALLLRMPYYNRPTQAGLAAHAMAAAQATGLEIILDNDPDRCGVEIAPETLERLEGAANVVGILERRGDLVRCDRIARLRDRRFMRLTGAAETIPAYLLAGGCGAVTSVGNLAPHWLARLESAARSELYGQAQILQRRLVPLLDLLAREPDPVLVKLALSMLHPEVGAACRAPLAPARPELATLMRDAIEDLPRPLAGTAMAATRSSAVGTPCRA